MGPERKRTAVLHFLKPHLAPGCPMVSVVSNLGEAQRLGALELNPWGGLVCGAALSYPNLSELPVWLGAHLSGRELGGPTFPSAAQ